MYAAVCHPVLTDPATERIKESVLKELVVTNSLPIEKEKMQDKLTVLSVAPLLGEAILRIFHDASVSALFDKCNWWQDWGIPVKNMNIPATIWDSMLLTSWPAAGL